MKNLLLFSIICFFMAIITLIFPYSLEGTQSSAELQPILGYMNDLALFQFVIYVIIIAISSFKQNIATAAIGLIFCFAFFLYFILLSTTNLLDVQKTVELGIGFYLAIGVAVLFWLCHVFNLLIVIKKFGMTDENKAPDLLDSL